MDSFEYLHLNALGLKFFAGQGELREDIGLIADHDVNDLISKEVNVAKDSALEGHSRQAYRVPYLRLEEGRLTLDQYDEDKDVVDLYVYSFLFKHTNDLVQSHQNAYLQPLHSVLF